MTKKGNRIKIGMEKIYEKVPTSSTYKVANNKSNEKKTEKNKDYEDCFATIKNFNEAFKSLPKFESVIKNLTDINREVADRREWMATSLNNLRTGKAYTYEKEFNQIKLDADEFFHRCNNAITKYNESNIFEFKKDSIENMKKVFLSDKYRPIFEKEGFKKEFEEAKSKVEAFITKKEEALNLFKELNQTVTFARQEYEKFAQEVPNYLDKSRSR